jgi:hypothetical protein
MLPELYPLTNAALKPLIRSRNIRQGKAVEHGKLKDLFDRF